jgi:putative SOS response-associated peptidase YedK
MPALSGLKISVHPCPSVVNHPYRPEMYWCPVSRALNNVRNEGPELIRPAPVQKDLL